MSPFDLGGCSEGFLREFAVARELGTGASGVVLLARQVSLNRMVAVKYFAAAEGPSLLEFRKRFVAEAQLLARLAHPNILKVYGAGMDGSSPYLIEEHLEGEPLNHLVGKSARCRPDFVGSVGEQVAAALDYAHGQGVVHRDVKPANVFLGQGGLITLLDFGLAHDDDRVTRMTATGLLLGTPAYLAPETVLGGTYGPASDAYALGVLLWELCCGELPHAGKGAALVLEQAVAPAPPVASRSRHELPAQLAATIDGLLMRDPTRRPALADVARLRARGAGPERARPASPGARGPSALRAPPRGRARAAAVAGLWLAAALLLGVAGRHLATSAAEAPGPGAAATLVAHAPLPVVGATSAGPTWLDLEVFAPQADQVDVNLSRTDQAGAGFEVHATRAGTSWRARAGALAAGTSYRLRARATTGRVAVRSEAATAVTSELNPRPVFDAASAQPRATWLSAWATQAASAAAYARNACFAVDAGLVARPPLVAVGFAGAGVACIDARRGALVWHVPVPWRPRALATHDELLYAAGEDGRVHAYRWTDGAQHWESSPRGLLGRTLLGTPQGVVLEVQDVGFACLEQATGALKWEVRNAWLEGPPTATHDGRLWLRLLPAGLRCLDLRSGAMLSAPDLPALGTVVGAPVVRGREVVAALKAGVLALAGSSGPPRLTVPLKGTPLGLTDAGERLLLATLTDPPELVAVEPGSGSIAWRRRLPVRPASAAVVRDSRAYVLYRSHGLSCFALRDGSPLWSFGGSGRRCCGDPVFDDRGVLWADDQGRIWAVDDQPPADLR